jgi:uncharacterized protein (TIGR02646 family)
MRYLKKNPDSRIEQEGLKYSRNTKKNQYLRSLLLDEQKGFCAYSEKFISSIDASDIEHFDPRLKNTDQDNYRNLYAVCAWINQRKSSDIQSFEPILHPSSEDLLDRIHYVDGVFRPRDSADQEAENLIKFLGVNRPELYQERLNHIRTIRDLQQICGPDPQDFWQFLARNHQYLSFSSALIAELDFPEHLWDKPNFI